MGGLLGKTWGFVLCYRKEQQKHDFQTDKKKGPLGAGLRAKDYTSVTQTWPGFLERPLNVFFPPYP